MQRRLHCTGCLLKSLLCIVTFAIDSTPPVIGARKSFDLPPHCSRREGSGVRGGFPRIFEKSSMYHSEKFARGAYAKPHKKGLVSSTPPPSMPRPGGCLVWLEKQNFTAAVHGCGLKFMFRSGDKPVGRRAHDARLVRARVRHILPPSRALGAPSRRARSIGLVSRRRSCARVLSADRQLEFVVRPWLRPGRRDARARGLRAARVHAHAGRHRDASCDGLA